jgi:ribosomal protein L37AE/L43A
MTTFDNEIKQKISKKYFCEKCDYNTDRKSNLSNHLLSAKHIKTTNDNKNKSKISAKHKCYICEKEYNDRAGLWRHKKKCFEKEENTIIEQDINDKNLILTLIQQNNELQKQMLEVIKNGTINNTINNTNNSHNKTFNLQLFLNETCKDAMNIMDFVDSIKIQLCDIESIGELGFVNGMSKLIIKNLNALAENMRPVHCNDPKRDSLYVKDANVWEKEDSENKKIKKAIKYISHKNICAIPEWKAKYPDCIYSDSKKSNQYNHIVIEAMGGPGDNDEEKVDKIVKKIAKEVTIDKNN